MPLTIHRARQRARQLRQTLQSFPWRNTLHTLKVRFSEDQLGLTASSLTFTTLLALVPFFTVLLSVFTAFPSFGRLQETLQRWLVDSLIPVVKRKYQTLSYLGLEPEALRRFVRENALWGVDRIAPVGHTMDFALTWDGYDLIRTLSRRISAI